MSVLSTRKRKPSISSGVEITNLLPLSARSTRASSTRRQNNARSWWSLSGNSQTQSAGKSSSSRTSCAIRLSAQMKSQRTSSSSTRRASTPSAWTFSPRTASSHFVGQSGAIWSGKSPSWQIQSYLTCLVQLAACMRWHCPELRG